MTAVYKTKPPELMVSFRPMFVLSPFAKMFEKILYQQLYNFLTKQNVLCDYQFGFGEGHSTSFTVTDVDNFILQNCDQQKFTCALFLDLSF